MVVDVALLGLKVIMVEDDLYRAQEPRFGAGLGPMSGLAACRVLTCQNLRQTARVGTLRTPLSPTAVVGQGGRLLACHWSCNSQRRDPSTPRGPLYRYSLGLHTLPLALFSPLFSTAAASTMSVGYCLPLLSAGERCARLGCWFSLVGAGTA